MGAMNIEQHMARTTPEHWFQKDGSRIHVNFMSPGHLKNTVRMIRRWAQALRMKEFVQTAMLLSSSNLSEGAAGSIERELIGMSEAPTDEEITAKWPVFGSMLKRLEDIEEEFRRELDECLYDPWGDNNP